MVHLLMFLLISIFGVFPEEIVKQSDSFSIGVVDRVEGELAVILTETEGRELIVPRNGHIKENNWFLIYQINNEPLILWPLYDYQKERKQKLEDLRKKLNQKKSSYP